MLSSTRVFFSVFLFSALLAVGSGCADMTEHVEPGGDLCQFQEVPANVVVRYGGGGGFAGTTISVTAFDDGRVEIQTNRDKEARKANVDVDRIRRLEADLRATNVMAQDEGCYRERETSPDGYGSSMIFRTDSKTYRYSNASGDPPGEVVAALDTAAAFAAEVDKLAPTSATAKK